MNNNNNINEETNRSILWVDEVLDSDNSGPIEINSSEEDRYYNRLFNDLDAAPGFTNLWDYWNDDISSSGEGWWDGSSSEGTIDFSWSLDEDGDAKMG